MKYCKSFFKKTRLGRQNKTCLLTKMHLNYHDAKNPTLEFYKSGISTLDSTFSFGFETFFFCVFEYLEMPVFTFWFDISNFLSLFMR